MLDEWNVPNDDFFETFAYTVLVILLEKPAKQPEKMRCMWYYYEMYPDVGNRQQLVDDFVWLEIVLKMGTILSIACKCAFHNIKDAFHGIISERNHTNIRKIYRIISS